MGERLNDIALCALPSLVPIPFGIQIESCYYNEAFIDEMKKISPEHGFWAKIFTDVIEQTETDSDIVSIVQRSQRLLRLFAVIPVVLPPRISAI